MTGVRLVLWFVVWCGTDVRYVCCDGGGLLDEESFIEASDSERDEMRGMRD
jgi:hypothetical protein